MMVHFFVIQAVFLCLCELRRIALVFELATIGIVLGMRANSNMIVVRE
jgi:hypothetical protein